MVEWALAEAATAMGAEVIGDGARRFRGVAIDSRAVRGGELFFALVGSRVDGHRFVPDAALRGAAAAVVARPIEVSIPLAVVDDPLAGLHALTRAVRRTTPRRLVAVTGSAGKTTTKELLAALLATRFEVAKSPGNLNNLYGFPLALLGVPEGVEWMVAEMGMSTPGELGGVSRLGRPDVCLFTNVGTAHLAGLGSRAALIDAKAELLEGLAPGGLVVANADNAGTREIAARHGGPTILFGSGQDYRVENLRPREDGLGSRFELVTPSATVAVELPLLGAHNVENFLAAATTAIALGASPEACAALAPSLGPLAGRGVIGHLGSGALLVDEAYNSNPEALRAALAALAAIPATRRRAVLGAMLELGAESAALHTEVGEHAAVLGIEVLAVGEEARPLAAAARADWVADAAAAAERLAADPPGPGEVVLVKGSRGIGLERVVGALSVGALSVGERG